VFRIVQVKGEDAASFLQGQLTQDVQKLGDAAALLAAWCNPKGRVIAVPRLLTLDDGYGLALPADLVEPVMQRLLMYRLRAKVDIALTQDWQSTAVAAGPDLATLEARGLLPDDTRGASRSAGALTAFELGARSRCVELYGPRSDIAALELTSPLSDLEWQHALVEAGIPTVTAATTEQYTPHMLNLDLLGAISFDKGCYTGQEIVARTEHRGQSKRRLRHYHLEEGTATVGDRLLHEDREVGEVLNAAGQHLLAVTALDVSVPVTVNGRPALPAPLPYAEP
jgi:tRNA-modifying protein YgfZ